MQSDAGTASLGNYVWLDLNQNGMMDEFESGIPDITIKLHDELGNVIDTTMTDGSGQYRFDQLSEGQYRVSVVLDSRYQYAP